MNRIYSNIKQIALSLLVVGLAISTQAFKSTGKFAPITYYQTSANSYNVAPTLGECDENRPTENLPCHITYAEEPSVTLPFNYASKPAGGTDSSEETIYVP